MSSRPSLSSSPESPEFIQDLRLFCIALKNKNETLYGDFRREANQQANSSTPNLPLGARRSEIRSTIESIFAENTRLRTTFGRVYNPSTTTYDPTYITTAQRMVAALRSMPHDPTLPNPTSSGGLTTSSVSSLGGRSVTSSQGGFFPMSPINTPPTSPQRRGANNNQANTGGAGRGLGPQSSRDSAYGGS